MAKERMINTRIWSDNWVSELDPIEKLLFLYFLTNSYTNISGVYELPIKVVAVETGIDPTMLWKILPRLEPKIIAMEGWVIIPNFTKYQNVKSKDVVLGIEREFKLVPNKIQDIAIRGGWGEGLGMVGGYLTQPNLTKPSVRANAQPYDLVKDKSDSQGESGDSKFPRVSGDKLKAYKELVSWSEKERGFPFLKTHVLKQYKAFKIANENGISRDQLMAKWEDMAADKFWIKNGFDWMNVIEEFNKKPV